MPEGDSVHRLARRLAPLTGREVTACQLRVPRLAATDLTGSRVVGVEARGKHLLMTFEGDTSSRWVLHTHLRMEGTWSVHPAGTPWRRPAHTARVVLEVSGVPGGSRVELVGHDLGMVDLWPAEEVDEHLGWLGPDPLAPDWGPAQRAEVVRRARAHPDRPVGVILLDQSVMAGIGNELRAETCFLTGLHPATPGSECDLESVVDTAVHLIQVAVGLSHRTSTGSLAPGETSFVFGRNHRPCRRCGTAIRSSFLGPPDRPDQERVIWWCPRCQPEPVGWQRPARGESHRGQWPATT